MRAGLFALVLALLILVPEAQAAPAPALSVRPIDEFYEAPQVRPNRPGMLIRSEPLVGVNLPRNVTGWRILYTTTIDDKTPATAVALVFAPAEPPEGPRPVIAWAHGVMGAMQKCMPSLLSQPGLGLPALASATGEGWVVVATDYAFAEADGPFPYLIGEGEARATLDAVRAAQQLDEVTLDRKTVVWGHSLGGHAALWAGTLARRYAPQVTVAGVAAIAPIANVSNVLRMSPEIDKRLGPYLALAYSRFYPDVVFDEVLRPEALEAAQEMVNLCGLAPIGDRRRFEALLGTFSGRSLAPSPALAMRMAANTPNLPIPTPVLVVQGLTDAIVSAEATDSFVERRCSENQRLEYWTVAGQDHGGIVAPGSPIEQPLIAWTEARFEGKPQPSGCHRLEF